MIEDENMVSNAEYDLVEWLLEMIGVNPPDKYPNGDQLPTVHLDKIQMAYWILHRIVKEHRESILHSVPDGNEKGG